MSPFWSRENPYEVMQDKWDEKFWSYLTKKLLDNLVCFWPKSFVQLTVSLSMIWDHYFLFRDAMLTMAHPILRFHWLCYWWLVFLQKMTHEIMEPHPSWPYNLHNLYKKMINEPTYIQYIVYFFPINKGYS